MPPLPEGRCWLYRPAMITEYGHFALILALVVAIVQTVVPMIGAHKRWTGWMAVAEPAAVIQFGLVAIAFAALVHAFVVSDFSLAVVVDNSSALKPMLYKITGTWGNHEGSLLLWVLILTIYGSACAFFGQNLPATLRARVLAVQGSISVAFLVLLLFTSNPFLRLAQPPLDGQGMNPLLQDPGLAFHPPFLYMGYVGLSMAFSFAIAALIEGRIDAAWGRWVRPWTLAAWMFLTIGIAGGSIWAYYELGWGGFWFWDPVENASFMPWLIAGALLHSAIVVEKRESLKAWTVLLAIIAFGFSLTGTFIVRSGVITSVHSFASDPTRGISILVLLALFIGGGLTLFAARGPVMEAKGAFALASRETALVANNILLAVAAFVVFVGTLWPLFAEMVLGRKLSVGAPFFNAAFSPFFLAVALLIPLGSVMPWKRARLGRALMQLRGAFVLAVAAAALAWAVGTGHSALAPLGAGLGMWLVAGSARDLWLRTGPGGMNRFGRLRRLPRADWGRALAHGGLGITIFGICALLAWNVEDIRVAQQGQPFTVGGYSITLQDVETHNGPNFIATTGTFDVARDGHTIAVMTPSKRQFPLAGMTTTEAAIRPRLLGDLYLVLGDKQDGGGWAVRTYVKPFAGLDLGRRAADGAGRVLSLTDRRYRVAAGASRAARPAASAQPMPAE